MRALKDEKTDALTKKAWEKNWDDISMLEIMEIFNYERVKKQMELFQGVLPKNGKILEGGCGMAPYLIRLRQLGYDVEGIDYNEGPIRKVLSFDRSLPVKVGDVKNIPYPDAYFSGYLSLGVIEHFTEGPRQAIREANRVLKKGGALMLMVPRNHLFMRLTAPARSLKRSALLRQLFNKPPDTHYWEQYFHRAELKKMLEEEGFQVREIHALDHSASWITLSDYFRDKNTFDEASPLALKLARWCEKRLKWSTAAQTAFVCYKK